MRCLRSVLLFVGHVQKLPKILRVVAIVPELFDEGNYILKIQRTNTVDGRNPAPAGR